MKTYELTYIISSQISSEEAESVKKNVDSLIQSKEGVILRSEKLGAQPLSYRIKKQGSGYFNIETLQVEEAKVKEITENLARNDKILRSMIVVKKPVKVMKERRSKRIIPTQEFADKRKSLLVATITEAKKGEKVDVVDLDKKLDELLSE